MHAIDLATSRGMVTARHHLFLRFGERIVCESCLSEFVEGSVVVTDVQRMTVFFRSGSLDASDFNQIIDTLSRHIGTEIDGVLR
jgi:hypothetical protein